jgi:hypothetical protein
MARARADDRILTYIEPEAAPASFLNAPATERAWRGRLYLATWVLTRHEAYSWAIALADDDDGDSRRVAADIDDRKLLAGLQEAGREIRARRSC